MGLPWVKCERGAEAAARMEAGDEVVELPLHGPFRRVRLPGFTLEALEGDPFAATSAEPIPTRAIEVPAEDVYVPLVEAGS